VSFSSGRDATAAAPAQEPNLGDILKLPGRVIARGSNTRPTGKFKLKSYRIEEVTLSQPVGVEIRGRGEQVTSAFRITVIGGPFPVRAMPSVIWVGDEAVGFGVESEDLDEITAVTFDRSLLREGSSLYLSYGDKDNKEDRSKLPEKLKLEKAKD
jgi:hypothetical protein